VGLSTGRQLGVLSVLARMQEGPFPWGGGVTMPRVTADTFKALDSVSSPSFKQRTNQQSSQGDSFVPTPAWLSMRLNI
jgi:hypothetical protein